MDKNTRHWFLRAGIVLLASSFFYSAMGCGGDMGNMCGGGGGGSAEESNAKPGGSCPPCRRYHPTAVDSNGCSLCDEGSKNKTPTVVQPATQKPAGQ